MARHNTKPSNFCMTATSGMSAPLTWGQEGEAFLMAMNRGIKSVTVANKSALLTWLGAGRSLQDDHWIGDAFLAVRTISFTPTAVKQLGRVNEAIQQSLRYHLEPAAYMLTERDAQHALWRHLAEMSPMVKTVDITASSLPTPVDVDEDIACHLATQPEWRFLFPLWRHLQVVSFFDCLSQPPLPPPSAHVTLTIYIHYASRPRRTVLTLEDVDAGVPFGFEVIFTNLGPLARIKRDDDEEVRIPYGPAGAYTEASPSGLVLYTFLRDVVV